MAQVNELRHILEHMEQMGEPGSAPEHPHLPPQDGLFDLPDGERQLRARIVLLSGPSGSGKTSLARRLGLPSISLDDFYKNDDDPGMPSRYGIIDWDSPESWHKTEALDALITVCRTGRVDLPIYDIPTNKRTGSTHLDLQGAPIVLAEGIFASELVDAARAEDILADAICIVRARPKTFFYRLMRDLGEARKPPLTLIRRGLTIAKEEKGTIERWVADGCQPLGFSEAEQVIRAHHRQAAMRQAH
ncbi:uridine kinase [Ruaniaceae bacterium KH17]|nr:uridine kinase [Ruaniaceae bacterium KH17]